MIHKWLELGDTHDRLVGDFMRKVGALPVAMTAPDPQVIWLRAQLLKRWDLERLAQLPLDLMQPIEILAGIGAAALALYWMPGLF